MIHQILTAKIPIPTRSEFFIILRILIPLLCAGALLWIAFIRPPLRLMSYDGQVDARVYCINKAKEAKWQSLFKEEARGLHDEALKMLMEGEEEFALQQCMVNASVNTSLLALQIAVCVFVAIAAYWAVRQLAPMNP